MGEAPLNGPSRSVLQPPDLGQGAPATVAHHALDVARVETGHQGFASDRTCLTSIQELELIDCHLDGRQVDASDAAAMAGMRQVIRCEVVTVIAIGQLTGILCSRSQVGRRRPMRRGSDFVPDLRGLARFPVNMLVLREAVTTRLTMPLCAVLFPSVAATAAAVVDAGGMRTARLMPRTTDDRVSHMQAQHEDSRPVVERGKHRVSGGIYEYGDFVGTRARLRSMIRRVSETGPYLQ